MSDVSEDPLDRDCPACDAEPKEACRPGCLGEAKVRDEEDDSPVQTDARLI